MSPNNIYFIIGSVFIIVIGYDVYNWLRGRTITAPEIRIARFRSKLNFTILILGITFLLASILFHVNIFRYTSPLEYSDIHSITLKDFKGYRIPYETLDGVSEFAFITTTIDWNYENNGVTVRALFHPSRSYVFNENTVDKFLLMHELYHFHITEIFARKCREQLSLLAGKSSKNDIEYIVEVSKDQEAIMQAEYDYETYHGYVLGEQKRWQLKIDSLLTSLNKFQSTKVRIPLTK